MEDITCQRCSTINEYYTEQSGNHIKAICNHCKNYIKFIPQGKPVVIYFGKYQGRELQSLKEKDEVNYLNWILGKTFLKKKLRSDIEAHLKSL